MQDVTAANELVLEGVRSLRGRIRVPGDKSISHRALLFAAAGDGRSVVRDLGTGDDVARTRGAIESLGVRVKEGRDGELRIQGTGWQGLAEPLDVIDCGNSGTAVRMLLGYLAGRDFHTVIAGDASIARRPMRRVVDPLRDMGATIDGRGGGEYTPLSVRGGKLDAITYDLPVASAQVKSALLLAGLQAEGTTTVREPAPSRDHTERMLAALGVGVTVDGDSVAVTGADLPAFEIDVPGDPSSAAFFLVGALICPDSEVTVESVALNPRRIGFVEVLRRMGADLVVEETGTACGEPVGDITARSSTLRGTVIEGAEIPSVIDEIPVLAVAAAFAEGATEVRDAEELRVKETDRIGAIEQELSQTSVAVETRRDGITIQGGQPCAGRFKSHGDHRIAMAAAVAAVACSGESRVQGWRAVSSSYPEFADHLSALVATP